MTIKWVKVDPLVMNGEPFCYGSRLTVRQVLELRANGYTRRRPAQGPPRAAARRASPRPTPTRRTTASSYAEFFEPDGSLAGPGYTEDEAAALPERLRIPGVVVKVAAPA